MLSHYWHLFQQLIVTPFHHLPMIWGIVPLYFGWLLNEITAKKANFRTALQTGFSFIWAALQWLYPYFASQSAAPKSGNGMNTVVSIVVTFLVLAFGGMAFVSGLIRRFPPYCRFLGHTRFSNYFMIAIYPMQAHFLLWTWDRLFAIVIFAFPLWVVLHFGLMPVRK